MLFVPKNQFVFTSIGNKKEFINSFTVCFMLESIHQEYDFIQIAFYHLLFYLNEILFLMILISLKTSIRKISSCIQRVQYLEAILTELQILSKFKALKVFELYLRILL